MSFASDYIWDVWSETSELSWNSQNPLTNDRRPEKGKSAGETDPLTGMTIAASPDLTGRGRPERQADTASQLVSPDRPPPSILL
jgi:hypothetical protein